MKTVSSNFKELVRQFGRELTSLVVVYDTDNKAVASFEGTRLNKMTLDTRGKLCCTIEKNLDVEVFGDIREYKGYSLIAYFGLKGEAQSYLIDDDGDYVILASGDYITTSITQSVEERICLGKFYINSVEYDYGSVNDEGTYDYENSGTSKLTCYDPMIFTHLEVDWTLLGANYDESYSGVVPNDAKLFLFIKAIAKTCGLKFTGDYTSYSDVLINLAVAKETENLTYRDLLDYAAQLLWCNIAITSSTFETSTLGFVYPYGDVVNSDEGTFKFGENQSVCTVDELSIGPINYIEYIGSHTVVTEAESEGVDDDGEEVTNTTELTTSEEYSYQYPEELEEGITGSLSFSGNIYMNSFTASQGKAWIKMLTTDDRFSQNRKMFGLTYALFDVTTFGDGYFEFGDRIAVEWYDTEDPTQMKTYECIIFNHVLTLDGGFTEQFYTDEDTSNATNNSESQYTKLSYEEKQISNLMDSYGTLKSDYLMQNGLLNFVIDYEASTGSTKSQIKMTKDFLQLTSKSINLTGNATFKALKTDLGDLQASVGDIIDEYLPDLQKQIDGAIDTWYYSGEPKLTNPPASSWTDDNTKLKHVGDLYYDKDDGLCYRFMQDSETKAFSWTLVDDEKVSDALKLAKEAQETADGKMTIFYGTPETTFSDPSPQMGDYLVDSVNNKTYRYDATEKKWTTETSYETAIKNVDVYFALSSSDSEFIIKTGTDWVTNPADLGHTSGDGYYIWQKTKGNKTDGTSWESSPVCIQGVDGEGVEIDYIEEQYYLSTSSTALAGGEWKTTPDAYKSGYYYWTRVITHFVDGTESDPSDPVLAQAINSANEAATGIISDLEKASTNYVTKINGGLITTGAIKSNDYTNTIDTDGYTTGGVVFNLLGSGYLKAENFQLNADGTAKFRGAIEGTDISIIGSNYTNSTNQYNIGITTEDYEYSDASSTTYTCKAIKMTSSNKKVPTQSDCEQGMLWITPNMTTLGAFNDSYSTGCGIQMQYEIDRSLSTISGYVSVQAASTILDLEDRYLHIYNDNDIDLAINVNLLGTSSSSLNDYTLKITNNDSGHTCYYSSEGTILANKCALRGYTTGGKLVNLAKTGLFNSTNDKILDDSSTSSNAKNCAIFGDEEIRTYILGASIKSNTSIKVVDVSDRNKKHDIELFNDNIEKVYMNLNPCEFKYNSDENNEYHFGFIAQDVEEAFNNEGYDSVKLGLLDYSLTKNGRKTDYGLIYSEFISMNTYMAQKLYKRIQDLEARLQKYEVIN